MQTPRRGRGSPALEGAAAAGGVGVGPALVHDPTPLPLPEGSVDDRATEVVQLRVALDTVAAALSGQAAAAATGRAGVVLAARAAMAAQPSLAAVAVEMVRENGMHPARAVVEAAHAIAAQVEHDGGDRARGAAVLEVGQRVARHLLGMEESDLAALTEPVVVIADDLSPAVTATLDPTLVRGLATRGGSRTSHTAILARSLGIPTVVGVEDLLGAVRAGSLVVVDGDLGQVLVDPASDTLHDVERRPAAERAPRRRSSRPGGTRDGHRVELSANVAGLGDLREALDAGAEGVGLWRTELDWLARTDPPDEEEQAEVFRTAAGLLEGRRLSVRTFDVGADKPVPFLVDADGPIPANPALGVRGLRLAKRHPDVLAAQLRAIVRAATHGRLAVLAPMVTTLEDVRWFRAQVSAAGGEADVEVGAMVEVPSAVLLAGDLARELDFLSIGTNDLGQYLHAADRGEGDPELQDPFAPAVLRSVAMVADAAEGRARVAVCGEAAGEPAWALLAVGLGVTELSMSADALPRVRTALASRSLGRCRSAAADALAAGDLAGVRAVAAALLG